MTRRCESRLLAFVLLGCACGSDPPTCTEGCDDPNAGMVLIPEGEFWMGCNPDVDLPEDNDGCENELFPATPYRQVWLSSYWVDINEVTFGEFAACVDAGACSAPVKESWREYPTNEPAQFVTWEHAVAYCKWVDKRLPTEAEWEKAARGTDGRRYPWGNEHPTCDHAVFNTNDKAFATGDCREMTGPEPVGSKPAGASVYGVNDMAGNMSEWVADWYAPGYDEAETHDPQGPASGEYKVVRSGNYGSWVVSGSGFSLRASIRKALLPVNPNTYNVGFRCARPE